MRAPLWLLLVAPGCFTPAVEPLVVDELAFENEFTQYPDIRLVPYAYDGLECPDGSPATVYAVYREDPGAPAPVVLAFHAGAFDYVVTPQVQDPLAGPHYQSDDRLTGDWASRKVFETLGLLEGDGVEDNRGALPAALANAGAFTLWPANCWGDLWHNETGYEPNVEGEGFRRDGRALAWAAVGMFSQDASTQQLWRNNLSFDPPIELDDSAVSLVGLGEGGRAAVEILRRGREVASVNGSSAVVPPVRAVAIDSTMDNLYPVWADAATFPELAEGIERIFPDADGGDIGRYSLGRWIPEQSFTGDVTVVWSSLDANVPVNTLSALVALHDGDQVVATDVGETGHVFSNGSPQVADLVVGRLLP